MPRKKRIALMITSIVAIIVVILGIFTFLYIKTDLFKSNETLFAKYFMQNFKMLDTLKYEENQDEENLFNTNKYTSNITGNIEYVENIGTSNENTNSGINKVGLKVDSKIDKTNNYYYRDVKIGTENEDLIRFEYLNDGQDEGIRLYGILQFVSTQDSSNNEEINKTIDTLSKINLNKIFEFSEEEKNNLENTYMKIVQSHISSDRYNKQKHAIITVEGQDYETNCYNVKMTIEELNNLYISILEQISQDEIILSKIDNLENQISELISENQEKSLRENFVEYINQIIEDIKDNNIGSEEITISVYEHDMQIIRTEIENTTSKTTIDFYNDSSFKITNTELNEYTNEEMFKVEKNNNQNMLVEFQVIRNSEITNDIVLNYQQNFENPQRTTNIQLEILNGNYKGTFKVEKVDEIVSEFDEQLTLEKDYVKINELPEERQQSVNAILADNVQKQIESLQSEVSLEDYATMLQNLLVGNERIQMPEENEVSDIEKTRFNSQFEFFASEGLTTDHIMQLMDVVQNNFEDMKILTKDGNIEDLDVNKLNSNNSDSTEYVDNISEILIAVKEDTKNEEKQQDALTFFESNTNNKYDVSIKYNDEGLAEIIRIKIQED